MKSDKSDKKGTFQTIDEKIDNKKGLILKALEKGNFNISAVCEQLGISRDTYYRYLKDESFKNKVIDIQEGITDFVESKLMYQIDKGNTRAIIFYLESKGRGRGYGKQLKIDTTLKVNEGIERLKQLAKEN